MLYWCQHEKGDIPMQELSKILETSLGGYSLSRILSAVLTLLVCLIV